MIRLVCVFEYITCYNLNEYKKDFKDIIKYLGKYFKEEIMKKLNNLSLLQREELFKTLRISITHHSNAIEGITLSYGETKTLLETGRTANNKPLDEQLIILGFAEAYDVIIREANDKTKILDSSFIKDLHYLIFF